MRPARARSLAIQAQERKKKEEAKKKRDEQRATKKERLAEITRQLVELPAYIYKRIKEVATEGKFEYTYDFGTDVTPEVFDFLIEEFKDYKPTRVSVKNQRCINYDRGDWEDYYTTGLKLQW